MVNSLQGFTDQSNDKNSYLLYVSGWQYKQGQHGERDFWITVKLNFRQKKTLRQKKHNETTKNCDF